MFLAVGIRRAKRDGGAIKDRVIVNWGAGRIRRAHAGCPVLNAPGKVQVASNKLEAFRVMKADEVIVPPFTADQRTAKHWVNTGEIVVCRTKLQGSGGDGIVLAKTEQELVAAPLYTKYKKKKSEWRIHIFKGNVIMVQRKVRDFDVPDEEVKWEIRNHANGFVFQQHGINPPVEVMTQSERAIAALGLDFGAVDVIWNERDQKAYVLEVNCAPGLVGTTIERYADAIKSVMNAG